MTDTTTTAMKVEVDPEQYEKLREVMQSLGIEAEDIVPEGMDEPVSLDDVRRFCQAATGQIQRQAAEALDDLMRMCRIAGEKIGKGETFTRRDLQLALNNRDENALEKVLGKIEAGILNEAPKITTDPKSYGGYL